MGFDNDLDMFDQYAATHAGTEVPRPRPRTSRAALFARQADEWDAGWGDEILGLADRLAESQPWRARAACAGMPAAFFFPERGDVTKEAKEVCGRCPVRRECADYALDRPEKHGTWGSLSERARREIRRDRRVGGEAA